MRWFRSIRVRTALAFVAAVVATMLVFVVASTGAVYVEEWRERVAASGGAPVPWWSPADFEEARRIALLMGLASPVVLVAAFAFGLAFARKALDPLHVAATRARAALDGSEYLELPDRGIGDEWDELAGVTNQILHSQARTAASARAFGANAAHELQTPLTTMIGQVQVILRRERSPEIYRATLRVVEEAAVRLARLVEALLTLAQTDGGSTTAPVEPFDAMAAALEAQRRAAVAHLDATGKVRTRGESVAVLGSPLLAGRVLDNLLDNALRHGGSSVEVAVEADDRHVRMAVRDDGPGLPASVRERLFERFNRPPGPELGFGLGLAIARAQAEMQGGSLRIEDRPQGTGFVLELPRA